MVNLVITLRHALKYRGGRVVQRGETSCQRPEGHRGRREIAL